MAQTRIQDGLTRLVEYFLSGQDDEGVEQTLEVCRRLLER
jgi:lipase chaperone LimK